MKAPRRFIARFLDAMPLMPMPCPSIVPTPHSRLFSHYRAIDLRFRHASAPISLIFALPPIYFVLCFTRLIHRLPATEAAHVITAIAVRKYFSDISITRVDSRRFAAELRTSRTYDEPHLASRPIIF